MTGVNWLDWTILGVLAVSTLLSLKRGFVKEALSLLGWVAAFLISTRFSAQMAGQLAGVIDSDSLRYAASYVILFAATLMLGSFLSMLVGQLIKATGLSGADRLLGTAFGLARGLVVLLVALFVVRAVVPDENQAFIEESRLVPHIGMVEQWARANFAGTVEDYWLARPEN